jgi:hypothetical protein
LIRSCRDAWPLAMAGRGTKPRVTEPKRSIRTGLVVPPREAMPKAKAAAARALEIEDRLSEGHVSLGYVS